MEKVCRSMQGWGPSILLVCFECMECALRGIEGGCATLRRITVMVVVVFCFVVKRCREAQR